MPKMLLLKNCKPALDEVDPGNDITTHAVRQWALQGKINSVMVGNRRLINLESLLSFLSNPQPEQASSGQIRAVKER
jgi:hypothetical protein